MHEPPPFEKAIEYIAILNTLLDRKSVVQWNETLWDDVPKILD